MIEKERSEIFMKAIIPTSSR